MLRIHICAYSRVFDPWNLDAKIGKCGFVGRPHPSHLFTTPQNCSGNLKKTSDGKNFNIWKTIVCKMKGLIVHPVVWEHLCAILKVPIRFIAFPMEYPMEFPMESHITLLWIWIMLCGWRRSPISFKHVLLQCLLVDPHRTTYQSNLGVRLRRSHSRPIYPKASREYHKALLIEQHNVLIWHYVMH
jgi:hypothetical protein